MKNSIQFQLLLLSFFLPFLCSSQSLLESMNNGQRFNFQFNSSAASDIGNFYPNQVYLGVWDGSGFTVEGNNRKKGFHTQRYNGGNPSEGVLILWGGSWRVNDSGELLYKNSNKVAGKVWLSNSYITPPHPDGCQEFKLKASDISANLEVCNGDVYGQASFQGIHLGHFDFENNGKGMYVAQLESSMAGIKIYYEIKTGKFSYKYGYPDPTNYLKITYTERYDFD